jgi:serine/threonine protein kinase
VKLLDLGLAKETGSGRDLTVAGSVFGTPNYISPEAVHDSKAVDARSDVFSLGATLYEAAAGRPPFEGANAVLIMDQVCNRDPTPLRQINPDISPGLEAVIRHAMAKNPAKRYAEAADMKADLERVDAGAPPAALKNAHPEGRKSSASGRRRKSGRTSGRSKKSGGGVFGKLLALFGLGKR